MREDIRDFVFSNWWWLLIAALFIFWIIACYSDEGEREKLEAEKSAKREAAAKASKKRGAKLAAQRQEQAAKLAAQRQAQAAEREELKAKQTKELLSYMPIKLSQLTPLVSRIINNYDFSECHNSIQLVSPSEAQSVLREYSEDLERDYREAIKEYTQSGYSTSTFPHRKKAIREKYNQLTEKAVEIGARAIAKQISYTYNELDTTDVSSERSAQSSQQKLDTTAVSSERSAQSSQQKEDKKIIRKTKKWKDD